MRSRGGPDESGGQSSDLRIFYGFALGAHFWRAGREWQAILDPRTEEGETARNLKCMHKELWQLKVLHKKFLYFCNINFINSWIYISQKQYKIYAKTRNVEYVYAKIN
jgi:hypothetical protein